MAKNIIAKASTVVITNTFKAEPKTPLTDLASPEGVLYNTGLNAVNGGTATVPGEITVSDWNGEAIVNKHIASIRLFGGNSYVFLQPGDSITLATTRANETAYYATLEGDLVTVKITPAEGAAAVASEEATE